MSPSNFLAVHIFVSVLSSDMGLVMTKPIYQLVGEFRSDLFGEFTIRYLHYILSLTEAHEAKPQCHVLQKDGSRLSSCRMHGVPGSKPGLAIETCTSTQLGSAVQDSHPYLSLDYRHEPNLNLNKSLNPDQNEGLNTCIFNVITKALSYLYWGVLHAYIYIIIQLG